MCINIALHKSCVGEQNINRQFPSCLSPLFQSESKCEAFHIEISFIHMQILFHLLSCHSKFEIIVQSIRGGEG